MGDMSGEYAGHARTGMFSASRNCVQILATWTYVDNVAVHYHAATWGESRGWMAQQWASGSRHGISVHSKYTAHPHNAMHAVCHLPCIVKTGDLSVKRTPLQSARRHRMWAFAHSSRLRRRTAVRSRPRWGWRASRWASLRWFWQFVQKFFGYETDCCSSCPGGWSQMILEVKMLDVEVLGWCGYTWSAVVSPVGCTAKFSETPLETAYGREMNIQFTGNSSGGHSCSQHANCTFPQNLRHLWHCAVW